MTRTRTSRSRGTKMPRQSSTTLKPPAAANSPRDYAEIGAAFVILVGIILALNALDLLPQRLALSDQMSYGLVFVIGLVASVSSCIAVTGGLLVAVAAKYNDATGNLTSIQRLKPHLYFNAGSSPSSRARPDRGCDAKRLWAWLASSES